MKKTLKVLARVGVVLILVIFAFVIFVFLRWNRTYDAAFSEIKATTDSALIARGRYLVYGPAHCVTCHTPKEQFAAMERGELIPLIGGGEIVFEGGTFRARNLTPHEETGIGRLTDPEVVRVMRNSIGHDGRLIFPFMPFQNMTDEDVTAIVSFLRSQEPANHKIEPTEYTFLGKAILSFGLIEPQGPDGVPMKSIQKDSTAIYGKYLVNSVANCVGCHSPRDLNTGEFTGPKLSGGLEFIEPNGYTYVTPNLTPDHETGVIAKWTEEAFIQRFRAGRIVEGTPMPWSSFSRMEDVELKAVYRYLNSLNPESNKVEKTVYAPGETVPE